MNSSSEERNIEVEFVVNQGKNNVTSNLRVSQEKFESLKEGLAAKKRRGRPAKKVNT